MIGLYIIGAFAVVVAYGIFKGRLRSRFYEAEGRSIFQDVYSGSIPTPIYQYRISYGFPSFSVRFKTANERLAAEAEGRNGRFKAAIGQLCKDAGNKRNPFDVARGVSILSQEELDAWIKRAMKDIQHAREQRSKAQPAAGGYSPEDGRKTSA